MQARPALSKTLCFSAKNCTSLITLSEGSNCSERNMGWNVGTIRVFHRMHSSGISSFKYLL